MVAGDEIGGNESFGLIAGLTSDGTLVTLPPVPNFTLVITLD